MPRDRAETAPAPSSGSVDGAGIASIESIEAIVCTEDLVRRPAREPDHETESRALMKLVEALADAPQRILQTLAEEVLHVGEADSAGVSLLTGDGVRLVWPGIAGRWKPAFTGGTPRAIGPYGDLIARNAAWLLRHDEGPPPSRLLRVGRPTAECLLVPFRIEGEPGGAIWAIAHDEGRTFDAEDLRQLECLGRFASAAHEVVARGQHQDARRAALNLLEDAVEARESLEARNAQLRVRTDELSASELRLAAELDAAERLQHVATALVQAEDDPTLFEQLLDTARAMMKSDFASIQMFCPERGERGELRLLAFRGFDTEAARFWEWVPATSKSTCGVALTTRERVIVPDVERCGFITGTDDLTTYRHAGIRAVQSTPLVSGSGRLVGMVSTHWSEPHEPPAAALRRLDVLARLAADVIERSQAARALRESEERYRTLVNAITDVPWTTDAEGAFVTAQPAWEAFTGQSWEEYRGFGWTRAIHEEDRERVRALWMAACRAGTAHESHGRLWHATSGTYRHFAARATPVFRGDGSVGEWVGSCTDVTAERRAADEREELLSIAERARGEAEMANHAKDEFLAVVSHELRSPMNAMLGWLRILKTAGVRDPNLVSKAADTIERNVWVQTQVINDLLDVSRIMSGKLQLEHERVEVLSVVMGCVESLRPSAEGKQVTLRVKSDGTESEVIGDGARLQQVVGNLVGNAIKFTDSGGFITVGIDATDTEVEVSVGDTGHGMSPDLLPHVFERFWQGDSSTARKHGGLGLGLAIVKHVVDLHGGRVEVESAGLGRGTRFTVTLPRAGRRGPVAFHPPRTKPETELAGIDVLLVEDDLDSRLALEMALEENGVHVRTAASVRRALEAYDARPPDVLVSDIGMPGEDGYALIRAIRALEADRHHRTLAIAMTGFAGAQDREMALRAGFDDHLGKPVEPDVLLERVRVLAASRER